MFVFSYSSPFSPFPCWHYATRASPQRYAGEIASSYSSNYFEREVAELAALPAWGPEDRLIQKKYVFTKEPKRGYGKQSWPDMAKYEGEWRNNQAYGNGTFTHLDGDVYVGSWKDNIADGMGVYHHQSKSTYQGQFCASKISSEWFPGMFHAGQKHGCGIYKWPDGSQYVGEWSNNKIDGYGMYLGKDGREYRGQWFDSVMHGVGVYQWADGRKYEGGYVNDKKEGFGVFEWQDGRKYEGQWFRGKQHGFGRLCLKNCPWRHAEWDEGKRIRFLDEEVK